MEFKANSQVQRDEHQKSKQKNKGVGLGLQVIRKV